MSKRYESDIKYQFKVKLKQRRSIWRSVVLRGDQTLADLHEVIFTAFERYDEHLYSFYLPSESARRSPSGKQPREYAAPHGFHPVEGFDPDGRFSAASATLDELEFKIGQSFEYLFDFGDEWWHEITVEALGPSESGGIYPRIVGQRGASPPQYPESEE